MKLLKNRLAECLAAKKMNQSWLASRLRMSRAYVSRLVRGKIRPSLPAAIWIAQCLSKPVEEVFQLVEEEVHQFPGACPPAPGKPIKPAENNESNQTKGKSA